MRTISRLSTLSLALVACLPGMAQDTTATLLGTVTDRATGKPLAGATVTITSKALLGSRTAVTREDGSFRVPLLPNGDYAVSAARSGFVGTKATLKLIAGLTVRQDLALRAVEATGAVVEVVSTNAPQVDKTQTTTQSAYTMETLNTLYSSNLNAALNFSPGQVNKDNGGLTFSSMRGGNSGSTKFLVNGVSANESKWGYSQANLVVVQDLVESFSIIQSPLNAKYGNTDGGVVSMVTSRGSNDFKGSVRVDLSRGGLRGALEGPMLDRVGNPLGSEPAPPDDNLGRDYEVTLSGPLIKDRLTFAYGGKFTPPSYWRERNTELVSTPDPLPTNRAGIYYRDPATGVEVRNAYLADQGEYYPNSYTQHFNQYALFLQITSNHSLEYNFTDWGNNYKWKTGIEIAATTGKEVEASRFWNVGYKGMIGAAGLLEARVGKISRSWTHPYHPGVRPIQLTWYGTRFPDANGKYFANSALDARAKGAYTSAWTVGSPYDKGDTIINHTMSLNYMHILDFHGQHQIDVGFERQKYEYESQAGGHPTQFYIPGGRIDPNLQASDLIRNGYTGAVNPGAYAGKYIMWGYNTPLNQLDPTFGTTPLHMSPYAGMIPSLAIKEGPESSILTQPTDSFYINDLWSVNSHWTVMAGLRYDRFSVGDVRGKQHQYSKLSPRVEVKWDPRGDQSRLINASYAQFHNRPPSGLFDSFLLGRLGYKTTLYYTGPTAPHLLDAAAATDVNNYKYVAGYTAPGVNVIDENWKADSSHELSVGYRRAYANGGYLRATFVYRWWADMFDFFPEYKGTTFTNPYQQGAQVTTFRRVLRNDPDAERTYRSLELEWMAPLSKRLTMMGNYTFARNVGNVSGIQNNPYSDGIATNWLGYLTSRYPLTQDMLRPVGPVDTDHTFRAAFMFDLSVGKVKSSLTLRASYSSGSHFSRTMAYNLPGIPQDLMPGYTDTFRPGSTTQRYTAGIPTNYSAFVGNRGAFIGGDGIGTALKYNLEIPIARRLRWWMGLEISNPFNHIFYGDASIPGAFGQYDTVVGATPNVKHSAYGYRLADYLGNVGIQGRYGLRSMTLETGLRF